MTMSNRRLSFFEFLIGLVGVVGGVGSMILSRQLSLDVAFLKAYVRREQDLERLRAAVIDQAILRDGVADVLLGVSTSAACLGAWVLIGVFRRLKSK